MTLPNFLVIGAYKSATTSLHHALSRHPQVFVPAVKEPNFFAFEENPDLHHPAVAKSVTQPEEYERLFEGARDEVAIGEVSPEYLANPWACQRIKARIPDARLVAVLRNPVERAYSDYLMYVRDGEEPCSDFGEALTRQESRYQRGEATGYYIRTGFYARQLRPYFEAFPSHQLQVHLFEDLVSRPQEVLARVFDFVGVDASLAASPLGASNPSAIPRNAIIGALYKTSRALSPTLRRVLPSPMYCAGKSMLENSLSKRPLRDEHRNVLIDVYRDDILELESMLGRPLSHWLTARTGHVAAPGPTRRSLPA